MVFAWLTEKREETKKGNEKVFSGYLISVNVYVSGICVCADYRNKG